MAEVYKVWDQERATHLALKLLREDLAQDPVFIRRFKREAHVLSKLQHPNITRFYGLDQDDLLAFMLMDYVDGTSLRAEIFRSHGKPFSPGRALEIMRPVCSALHYAHRMGMVHCDVKPGNILIDKSGRILVTDFGIARMAESATVTMVGAGTPAYMAPEQARGENPSQQTDIYALGIVLFEMLTGGERPFTGESARTSGSTSEKIRWEQLNLKPPSPRKFNPDLLPELEAIVQKCLEKEPQRRYKSTMELLNVLEAASENPPTLTQKRGPAWHQAVERPAQNIPERNSGFLRVKEPKGRLWVWVASGVGVTVLIASIILYVSVIANKTQNQILPNILSTSPTQMLTGTNSPILVAQVGDAKITIGEWQARVRMERGRLINQANLYRQNAQYFGVDVSSQIAQINEQMGSPVTLGQTVLDRMIDEELIRQEAAKRGITASKEDVDSAIQASYNYFPNGTPTPTITPTSITFPTLSPQTLALVTITPTPTFFATASAPFTYTVQEGDSLAKISEKFNLGDNGILLLLQFNPTIDRVTQIVFVGQQITVPNPGMELFTSTPVPANLPRGTRVPYIVQPGDSLAKIASLFNSTVDEIIKVNNLADANSIYVGQSMQIPVNLVTPTAKPLPISTPYTLQGFENAYKQGVDSLAKIGLTEEQIRILYETNVLRDKLYKVITADVPRTQEQVWARHILVADESAANAVEERLSKGEDFATLAREFSTDTGTKDRGGDLGWFGKGVMVPEFEQAVFTLKVDEISQPVKSQFGYHIIQVLAHADALLDANEYEQARQTAFNDWLAKTRDEYKVVTYDDWQTVVPTDPAMPALGQ